MGISLGDNIKVTAGLPVDCRYQNGSSGPYSGTSEAISVVTSGFRYTGLTVNVLGTEYWWKEGIADNCLVIKESGGAGTITGGTNGLSTSGENIVLGGTLTGNTNIDGAYTLSITGVTKLITTDFQMINGAASGCVMQSDASGNASWSTPAAGFAMSGSCVGALTTYVDATTICAEPKVTFDGSTLKITGNTELANGANRYICMPLTDNGAVGAFSLVIDGQGRTTSGAAVNSGQLYVRGGCGVVSEDDVRGGCVFLEGGGAVSQTGATGGYVRIAGGRSSIGGSGVSAAGSVILCGGEGCGTGTVTCGCVVAYHGGGPGTKNWETTPTGLKLANLAAQSTETDILYIGSDGILASGATSGGGGIAMSGSTVGGLTTYVDANTICAQPNITFTNNTDLIVSGDTNSDYEIRARNTNSSGITARGTVIAQAVDGGDLGMFAYSTGNTSTLWGEAMASTSLLWAGTTTDKLLIGTHKTGSPVKIYHGGSLKLATTDAGVCVSARLFVSGATYCVGIEPETVAFYRNTSNYITASCAGGTISLITNGLAKSTASALVYLGTDGVILRHGAVTPEDKMCTTSTRVCFPAGIVASNGTTSTVVSLSGYEAGTGTQHTIVASNKGTGSGQYYAGYFDAYSATAEAEGRSNGVVGIAGNRSAGYNNGVIGKLCGTCDGAGVMGTIGNEAFGISGCWAGYFCGPVYMSTTACAVTCVESPQFYSNGGGFEVFNTTSRLCMCALGGGSACISGASYLFLKGATNGVYLYHGATSRITTTSAGATTTGVHCATTCVQSVCLYGTTGVGGAPITGHNTFQTTTGLAGVLGTTTSAGCGALGHFNGTARAGVFGFCSSVTTYSPTTHAGYFVGCVCINDTQASGYGLQVDTCGCAVDFVATSDRRMKKCVVPITSALSTVDALCGRCYDLCKNDSHDMGLIAQEVLEVEPRLVTTGVPSPEEKEIYGIEDQIYGLKYDKFAGLFVEAIKELKTQNECLQEQINELRNK